MCRLCSLHKINQNQRRTDFLSNVLGKDEAMCMEISSVASLPMEPCQFSSEVNGKQHFFLTPQLRMPYKAKPCPWIQTEDNPGWESNELMCWQKAVPCWCRKKRSAPKWEIRSSEKVNRWDQNYELLKLREDTPADTSVDMYGSLKRE